jgi:hypothetical protein
MAWTEGSKYGQHLEWLWVTAADLMSDATVWQNDQGDARRVKHEAHLPETMRHKNILYVLARP